MKTMRSAFVMLLPMVLRMVFAVPEVTHATVIGLPPPKCVQEKTDRLQRMWERMSEKDIAQYTQLAEAGDVSSISLLARLKRKGLDGKLENERQDYWQEKWKNTSDYKNRVVIGRAIRGDTIVLADVVRALEETAQAGTSSSAISLGRAYSNNGSKPDYLNDLPYDWSKAIYWYGVAARFGDSIGMEALCVAHANGETTRGIQPNLEEAAKWCVVAAQAECNTAGPVELIRLFECGLGGLPRDLEMAAYWRRVAHERRWGTAPHHTEQLQHFYPTQCK